MRERVLNMAEKTDLWDSPEFVRKSVSYAKFLSQPLAHWMFVPVAEDGEVLEKPQDTDGVNYEQALKEYWQAKSRCLFEGFEVKYYESAIYFDNTEGSELFQYRKRQKQFRGDGYSLLETIEDLIPYGLTLTENGIKQAGL